MSSYRKSKLIKKIISSLAAGMLGFSAIGYTMPVVQDWTPGVSIESSTAVQMDIKSTALNNVINWQSFNIANGEMVQFDSGFKTNNYLNLIRDANASNILGKIEGGNNIYLINPNGVLFGAGSSVNVGNLYVSARPLNGSAFDDYVNTGTMALQTADSVKGDIINLGTMNANNVCIEGNNVYISNSGNLQGSNNVIIRAKGDIDIGHIAGAEATGLNAAEYNTDSGKKASTLNWTLNALDGKAAGKVTDYMLVRNVYELQNMRNNLSGNYMLANDIDAESTSTWNSTAGFIPVGTEGAAFTGKFNGLNFEIKNLYINRPTTENVGLFGYVGGATLKSVNLYKANITGKTNVGAIAGTVISSENNKAYISGYSKRDKNGEMAEQVNIYGGGTSDYNVIAGGLIGKLAGSYAQVDGHNFANVGTNSVFPGAAVDQNKIDGAIGGIIGELTGNNHKINAHNEGVITGNHFDTGGLIGRVNGENISITGSNKHNTSAEGKIEGTRTVGGLIGTLAGNNLIIDGHNEGWVNAKKLKLVDAGTVYLGGLIGNLSGSNTTIKGYNKHKIHYSEMAEQTADEGSFSIMAGGLVGNISGDKVDIFGYNGGGTSTDMPNEIVVTKSKPVEINIGGLVGCITGDSTNIYGYNQANLSAKWTLSTDATGKKAVGGLVGRIRKDDSKTYKDGYKIYGYNEGALKIEHNTNRQVAAIVGDCDAFTTPVIINAYHTGTVSVGNGDNQETSTPADTRIVGGTNHPEYSGQSFVIANDKVYLNTRRTPPTPDAVFNTELEGSDMALETYSDYWGTDISSKGGEETVWRIYDGKSLPYLRSLLEPVTISGEGVYTGQQQTLSAEQINYLKELVPGINVSSFITEKADAGSYVLDNPDDGVRSDKYDFNINYKITPREIALTRKTSAAIEKVYDATADTEQTLEDIFTISGTDGLTDAAKETLLAVKGKYEDKNVGEDKNVNFKDNISSNYKVTAPDAVTGNINKLALTLEEKSGLSGLVTKAYDGTTNTTATLDQLFEIQTAGLASGVQEEITSGKVSLNSIAGVYESKDAGERNISFAKTNVLKGAESANYTINTTDNYVKVSGKINPKELSLSAKADAPAITRAYDGTAVAGKELFTDDQYTLSGGIVSGDTVKLVATADSTFGSKNAGDTTVTYTVGLSGADAGNYKIVSGLAADNKWTATGKITQKQLTLTGYKGESVIYDGTDRNITGYTYNSADLAADDRISFTDNTLTARDAGTYSLVPGYTIADGNGGNNYKVTGFNNSTLGKLTITPRTLVLTAKYASSVIGEAITPVSGTANWGAGDGTETDAIIWYTDANKDISGKYKITGIFNEDYLTSYSKNYIINLDKLNAAANATAYTVFAKSEPPKPIPPDPVPPKPQEKGRPDSSTLLRDEQLADSQKQLLIQYDSEEKKKKKLAEEEAAEVSPEIGLPENKGLVNGEQLAGMFAAADK